jgi:hypothetical protein
LGKFWLLDKGLLLKFYGLYFGEWNIPQTRAHWTENWNTPRVNNSPVENNKFKKAHQM